MIREHDLQPGDRLPSERELARTFGLNHQTIRKAMAVLVQENVIDRRVGAGTFLLAAPDADGAAGPAVQRSSVPSGPTPGGRGGIQKASAVSTVVFVSSSQPFTDNVYSFAVQEAFAGSRWSVSTRCGHANLEWYANILADCRDCPPAGMILATVAPQSFRYDPRMLPQACTKVVLLGHEIPGQTYDLVRTNAYYEGIQLGDYIADRGYQNLLYVSPSKPDEVPETQTLLGLTQRLSERGIFFGEENIRRYDDRHSYGPHPDPIIDAYHFVGSLLRTERPRCIIAGHDWVAVGVVRALQDAGVAIPGEMAVISAEGVGNTHLVAGTPKLTTFDTLYYFRARAAAELLKRRLEGDDSTPRCHEFHGRIIEGETG